MPHTEPRGVDQLAHFEPVLRARACRLIGPRLRAKVSPSDLLQETLLSAVRRYAELSGRPPRLVLAWLLKSMQFRLMRYVRDHRAELAGHEGPIPVEDLKARSSAPPLSRMARDELRGALLGMIETLPEAERHVVVLLYRERRTTAEIAAELGRSEGAIRALHQRAIRRLRERLGDRQR